MAYIYLIRGGAFYKIGIADNPQKRLKELQTGNAERLELVRAVACLDAKNAERFLHSHFRRKQRVGEWFFLTDRDITSFDRRCGIAKDHRIRLVPRQPKGDAPVSKTSKPWIERFKNQSGHYYLRERRRVKKNGVWKKEVVRYIGPDARGGLVVFVRETENSENNSDQAL